MDKWAAVTYICLIYYPCEGLGARFICELWQFESYFALVEPQTTAVNLALSLIGQRRYRGRFWSH